MIVGYARVSSVQQDLAVQREQLKAVGAEKIFEEKESGASTEKRAELQRMLEFVREGDTVVVTKTDRIARNALNALEIADQLQAKNVGFKLLDLGDVDINSEFGRVIYTVMSAFAEMERKRITRRIKEGIDYARANGRVMGRPGSLTPDLLAQIKAKAEAGEPKARAAKALGIARNTYYKGLRELGLL